MEARTSAWEMFFGNVLDQLSSAALLDVATLESIAADVDAKVESLQERVLNSSSGIRLVAPSSGQLASSHDASHCESDLLALNCFLTNVVQALECNQGLEDNIMKELLSFCSRNGFLLPPVSSEIEQNKMGSSASLNTVSAVEEETKLELWNKIKSKVKAGITNKLQHSNILNRHEYEQPGYQKEIVRRVQYIDLLMVLFPVEDILDLYAKTRETKLEQVLAGTKKYSVSWADETDIEKVKVLENLEVFVVNQLNMLNMDVSVLWKINEYMPRFNISDFIEKVYFPQLCNSLEKIIQCFGSDLDNKSQAANLLLPSETVSKQNKLASAEDIRFIAKAFAIVCNWENEVKEIVDFFAVKPERRFSGDGLRSVLKASPSVSPSTSKMEGLDKIIWDKENDKHKNSIEEKWAWRESFKCLIPDLCKAITGNLNSPLFMMESNETEKDLEMIHVNESLFFEHPNYPQQLPKNYAKMVSSFDEVLPLASFIAGNLFEPVQNAFIDCVTSNLREYHRIMNETLQAFPENSDVRSLYPLICTAAFFKEHLEFYEENMTNLQKKPFQPLIKMFSDLMQGAKSTVILYHLKILTTSLLFDGQSNNWSDNKSFFEGERYSYCIQTWAYYINCIHNDIWHTLPQIESEQVLSEVVTKSLIILTGRYSKLRPSFARTRQYSCDVTAICDVTTWLCWNLASLPSDILNRESDASQGRNWHSLCSSMLINMIFVSTPLKMIADHLTNHQIAENSDHSDFEPSKLLLMWSEPCVFPKPVNSLNEMDGREAVFIVFKLIVSQSYPKWPLVCQAILMRNALLPTLIASCADIFIQTSNDESPPENSNLLNDNFYVAKTTESTSLDLKSFFSIVYHLLFKSASKSDALAHFLMALANRENTWGLFDNHIVMRAKATHETPIWLLNVEKTLIPFLSRSFLPALEMICDGDRKRCQPSFAFTNLEMLPCGCATVPEDTSSFFSSEGVLLYQCLVSTLNVFTENLNTIPRIIAVFFNRLNEYLYQRHFSAATKSPGLKILAFISYKWLTTQENICLLFDFAISDDTIMQIKCFAELVWHFLFNLTTDVSQNSSIPSDILSHIKANKVWLQEKLKMLTNYFKASVVRSPANTIDQLPDELGESQYLALSSTLMALPECRESLKTFYDILIENQEKIEEKLLSSRSSCFDQKRFEKGKKIKQRKSTFNPLEEYKKFGEYVHCQEETAELEVDWSKWLYVADKFPVPALRRVILGRQEFLPESYNYLTDEEKIAHEKLLRYFENYVSPTDDRPLSSSSSSTRSSSVAE